MAACVKMRKSLRGVNSFQMILFAILFHSLISILVIYFHLIWFFTEEEKSWKRIDSGWLETRAGEIMWNRRSALNLLSNEITSQHDISVTGWWMDHAKWDIDIKCFNQKWSLCSKVLSTNCKIDGVRAIYQYVPFGKYNLDGLDLALRASSDQLEPQTLGATFGALALIKLNDGTSETIRIQFPANIDPMTLQSTSFTAPSNKSIISITLMLMCYGYSGVVHFTDVVVIPQHGPIQQRWQLPEDLISSCPARNTIKPSPSPKFITKQEQLFKFAKHSSHESQSLITLVTQLSMDRLSVLERSLRHWDGPVSLVIYIPTKGSIEEGNEWQKLYVQKKLKALNLMPHSQVTLVFGHSVGGNYPINYLRNVAIRQADTKYLLLVDADFQTSPDFLQRFMSSLKHIPHNIKTAYVIPAFEYMELPQKRDSVPQTKEELLQLLHREDPFILPFRMAESAESHRLTDYWRWYRADKPYFVYSYSDKYEPYVVLQKSSHFPMYDERFLGYGMNKVLHITELFASNFTFVVLPDVWLIHIPHKISSYTVEFLQNPYHRLMNRVERFEFLSDIMRKYHIGHCKTER